MNDKYVKPNLEVISFHDEDIIRTSGEAPEDEIGTKDMGFDWWVSNP